MPGVLSVLLAGTPPFVINTQSISGSDSAVAPADATASVTLEADGDVIGLSSGSNFNLVTIGDPADLEFRVDKVSGNDLNSGTVGAWIPFGMVWTLTQTGTGQLQFVGEHSVRVAATGQVLASGVPFTVTATANI